MKKPMFVCYFIFTISVFHLSIPNVIFGQSPAEQVFGTYKETFLHKDIRDLIPDVLSIFKEPKIQKAMRPSVIEIVLNSPLSLRSFDPEIDNQFLALLTIDEGLRALFRDERFFNVLKSTSEINNLIRLIEAVESPPPPPPPPCLPDRERPVPTTLAMVSGNNQNGKPGERLEPFVVVVLDEYNNAVSGVDVHFAVMEGRGTLSPDKKTTDHTGTAKTTLTLDSNADPNKVMVVAFAVKLHEALIQRFNATNAHDASSAPSIRAAAQRDISAEDVHGLLTRAKALPETTQADPVYQRDIAILEQLLATLRQPQVVPKQTALLPNYPNPFNPETWIPYQLSKSTNVTVSVYSVNGNLIRTLDLGHQPAGMYQSKSRAAYWDGRNEFGERVASGLYFYTLTAGDFTATRKMLIRK